MAQADLLRRSAPRKRLGFLPRFATGFLAAALVAVVLRHRRGGRFGLGAARRSVVWLEAHRGKCAAQPASSARSARGIAAANLSNAVVDETNELLDAGRKGEVEFTGTIEAMQPNAWIVSGLVVQTRCEHADRRDAADQSGGRGARRDRAAGSAGLLHHDRIIQANRL